MSAMSDPWGFEGLFKRRNKKDDLTGYAGIAPHLCIKMLKLLLLQSSRTMQEASKLKSAVLSFLAILSSFASICTDADARSTRAEQDTTNAARVACSLVDQPAEVIRYNLIYPDSAKRAGLEGKAYLALHIDTSGVVTGVSIMQSTGFAILDTAALECARNMLFKPAMNHGRVVASDRLSAFKFKKDEPMK